MLQGMSYQALRHRYPHLTTFMVYWHTGLRELLCGPTIAAAIELAGYPLKMVHPGDFYMESDQVEFAWIDRRWQRLID